MIELRHLDVRHFVIEECRRDLANGCTAKRGCIGLMMLLTVILLSIMSGRNSMWKKN